MKSFSPSICTVLLTLCLLIGSRPTPAFAQAVAPTVRSVTTYRFDNYQSGVNADESILTPANVTTKTFGSLFASAIDGAAYAQPLYLPNLTVSGTKHNVAYGNADLKGVPLGGSFW